MNIDQLLAQSLQLLGLGMGSVFIILTLLIGIITIISKLVPEELPVEAGARPPTSGSPDQPPVAAIQAAIHKYKKSRGRQAPPDKNP